MIPRERGFVTDRPIPCHASDAAGFLPGPLGLRLDEAFLPLAALSGPAQALDALLPIGETRQVAATLYLRFAPSSVMVSGPLPDGPFTAVDVGHGLTRFRLRGVEALHFLGHYNSADLHAAPIRRARAIRTGINHFDTALWWPNTRDVHILVERSLAQSFADHLRALALRHDPADPSLTPRPVAPDAPDRRG